MTTPIPDYDDILAAAQRGTAAIRTTPRGLHSDDFAAYVSLKATVPASEQADMRQAFLVFQDRAMMDHFIERFL